jgi:hypothetical protein
MLWYRDIRIAQAGDADARRPSAPVVVIDKDTIDAAHTTFPCDWARRQDSPASIIPLPREARTPDPHLPSTSGEGYPSTLYSSYLYAGQD